MKKSRFFGVLCSFIPGAAHMYLGLKRQGLQLMILFFLPMIVSDFLRISVFFFALPIIWFYSFFDALRKLNGEDALEDNDILPIKWIYNNEINIGQNKLIAYGLIILGSIMLLNRIVMPLLGTYFDWQVIEYLRTGVVALLFIAGGIKLLFGGRSERGADNR